MFKWIKHFGVFILIILTFVMSLSKYNVITQVIKQDYNLDVNIIDNGYNKKWSDNLFKLILEEPVIKYLKIKSHFIRYIYEEKFNSIYNMEGSENLFVKGSHYFSSNLVDVEWTRCYGSGAINTRNYSRDIALDKYGNVYIIGECGGKPLGKDIITMKLSSTGDILWSAVYDENFGDDNAVAVVIDKDCNVIVTGYTEDLSGNKDYITIKYDSAGIKKWVSKYNTPGNSVDVSTAIAVDSSGNVFVTGYSWTDNCPPDFLTVKYSSYGSEEWVVRYDTSCNYVDFANDVAVDIYGNVYITGSSYRLHTSTQLYLTLKYNSRGILQWAAEYQGRPYGYNEALAITVDKIGNVYVTGYSDVMDNFDYVTIKYDNNGEEKWLRRYNGSDNGNDIAIDIVVDTIGNVYVTGTGYNNGTSLDYVTVKYNPNGVQMWVAQYNSEGTNDDYTIDLDIDTLNNIYVFGLDYTVIKYSYNRNQDWVKKFTPSNSSSGSYEATKFVIDKNGYIYMAGSKLYSFDFFPFGFSCIKSNTYGVEQWNKFYKVSGDSRNYASAMVLDSSSNVYVTGNGCFPFTNYDYVTVKYNTAGKIEWSATYNHHIGKPGDNDEIATAITTDNFGYVYITGAGMMPGLGYNYLTAKYSYDGVLQWATSYFCDGYNNDSAIAIAVDRNGNVYVTGYSDSAMGYDYTTIKYNNDGNLQWVVRYNGPCNQNDIATAMVIDQDANVYVTGYSMNCDMNYDYVTVKYDSNGIEQWVACYNGPSNGDDIATAIAIDKDHNVYVTGRCLIDGMYDYATIKYNSDGDIQWVSFYYHIPNREDCATGIAVDDLGNVYVTGYSSGYFGKYAYVTLKYNSFGEQLWVARYQGLYNHNFANDITIDPLGNVYVTGKSIGNGTGYDYATVKYNSNGEEQWIARFNLKSNFNDVATDIKLDNFGNVYVTGYSEDNLGSVFTTIKYNQVTNYSFDVKSKWNLISVPYKLTNYSKTIIFPTSISNAFSYLDNYGYILNDTLCNGLGYWLKFAMDQDINIEGLPIYIDTIDVFKGWNIIGSITKPISVESISSIPPGMATSPFYEYVDGYKIADSILPGHGYWVKVSSPCKLILSSISDYYSKDKINIIFTNEIPPLPPNEEIMDSLGIPTNFMLEQNYPNPFNPMTKIEYSIPKKEKVKLTIYNVLGQEVVQLVNLEQEAGKYSVTWDSHNAPSGLYIYRLQAGNFNAVKKMLLLR
ncbi:MAG: Cell surface protein [Ignavibacteriae bacterium]|nr:MAG: Cell surface protein [Ignavibacteriota bacterium]